MPFGSIAVHAVADDYVTAIARAGGLPVALPALGEEWTESLVGTVDGIVLTGGPDLDPATYGERSDGSVGSDPVRDALEIGIARAALRRRCPVLAVCRGLQILNVATGGSMRQHVDGHLGASVRHRVDAVPGSHLARAVGATSFDTGSLHHQAVARLGTGLRITGRADDGTVEALEAADGAPLLAVQWHPELEGGWVSASLFAWLVARAEEARWT